VIGNAGSGKSYLARELARRRGLRYIDFDAAIVRPNWERVPRADRVALFEELTREGGWTIDGHLREGRRDEQLILSRADTVVWLDFPRWRVMASVIPRTLRNTVSRRPLWNGNVETWRMLLSPDHSIVWAWRMHAGLKRDYERLFNDPVNAPRTLIRLTSRAEVNRWIATA
jgi:adenylate kinase family enzyme